MLKIILTIIIVIAKSMVFAQCDTLVSPFSEPVRWGQFKTSSDFNGDGLIDIAIMAPKVINKANEYTGACTVYYGIKNSFNDSADLIILPKLTGHLAGINNCTTGDFNNDGFDDLVTANPFYGEPQLDRGFVEIYWGSENGLQSGNKTTTVGESAYGSFGSDILCLDYNGDGTDDLLVGARFSEILEGRIFIYFGSEDFLLNKPDVTLNVKNSQALYCSLSGDFNNDGFDDVLLRTNTNWNANLSQFYIFYGATKLKANPDYSFEVENFTPYFFLKRVRLIIGEQRNEKKERTVKGIRIEPNTIELLPWEITNARSVKINENSFLSFNSAGKTPLSIFEIKDEIAILSKTIELNNTIDWIWEPILLKSDLGNNKRILIPAREKNGQEYLLIKELR